MTTVAHAMKIGILGYGKVASCLARLLLENRSSSTKGVVLTGIYVRDLHRPAPDEVRRLFCTRPEEVIEDPEVELVVELIGHVPDARRFILRALQQRKHVVTANRPLMSHHGREILSLAQSHGVCVAFEGAVGCGIPVFRVLHDLEVCEVRRIIGIVNSTCNHILTCMSQEGVSLEEGLESAVKSGISEPNVSDDLDALDATEKLALLAYRAFGCWVESNKVYKRGIRDIKKVDFEYARRIDCTIRHLIIANQSPSGLALSAEPFLVPNNDLLSAVHGAVNAIRLETSAFEPLMLHGKGASPCGTAVSALNDILSILNETPLWWPRGFDEVTLVSSASAEACFYLRIVTKEGWKLVGSGLGAVAELGHIIHESAGEVALLTSKMSRKHMKVILDGLDAEHTICLPLLVK